ncbi:DUF4249 family protein [Fibrella aestuarina]|nr:DUF4249 family protein [Fibrella aestuarina]
MKPIQLSLLLICLALLVGCDRVITVAPVPYDGAVSIQSLITPGQVATAYIFRAVPYFDASISSNQLVARTAVVTLTNAENRETLRLDSTFNAVRCEYDYYFKGQRPVRAGQTYTLTVQVNGQTFTASATTTQRKATIDSVGYTSSYRDVYGEHEGVLVTFTDPVGVGDYYRYQMNRVIPDTVIRAETVISPCSIGKTTYVQEVGRSVYDDRNSDGTRQQIAVEPAFKHKQGQVAYIKLLTIDRNIFQFYDNLDRQKLAQFNPFVEPVYLTKPGQFGAGAVGVFGAYAVSDSVRFVYPE